ncbi:sarcosine oxidase subunit gamma [Roseibacterium sp. SDUM158016]|uniref:sarcosine oxidase subunit gamma n=1 Tax=Roseicyclus sediminis TaxID=2980997 RepID=UPI0021CECB28|nr:sarcosine oxidase subunit gamma family protein [Roseibacterium sp. SDUM158016]MCU4653190.1 sarcosine oxidase subunit gamma [Roseibacterium sp. SDUM158016]
MAELIARSAFQGLLPLRFGNVEAVEVMAATITSVSPFRGQETKVSKALEKAVGVPFPDAGRVIARDDVRAIWTGMGQCFVLGADPGPLPGAAVTDQTDAWGALAIEGTDARAVLARLVPIDLRPDVFAVGHAARTLFGHMACVLTREAGDRYGIMVFRSMAGSAAHELEGAMRKVAARERLQ